MTAATEPVPVSTTPAPAPSHRVRRIISVVLLVFGCIFAPLAIVANWTSTQLLDTNAYVETVAPLGNNPTIVNYEADLLTKKIWSSVNVESIIASHIPGGAGSVLAPLIAAKLEPVVQQQIHTLLSTSFKEKIWVTSNRVAHQIVVKLLTGQIPRRLSIINGWVVIDLTPLLQPAIDFLSKHGQTIFNNTPIGHLALKWDLFKVDSLKKAQTAVHWLDMASTWLPVLSVLALAGSVALSLNRRRRLVSAGIALAGSVALLGIGLNIGRGYLTSTFQSSNVPSDVTKIVFDTFVADMRTVVRIVAVVALLVALGAFLFGPSKAATWFRTSTSRLASKTTSDFGPLGSFLAAHRDGTIAGIIIVAVGVALLWSTLTPLVVLIIGIIALVLIGAVALIAARHHDEPSVPQLTP